MRVGEALRLSTAATWITGRLGRQRQASPRTIASYRDTLRLLLCFMQPGLVDPADKGYQASAYARDPVSGQEQAGITEAGQ
jgi:hypothetical protein